MGKRFDMLTSVQLYAASLIPDDAPFVDRHTDHFAALAIDALGPLDSDQASRWRAILEEDVDNLRATLDHLLTAGDIQRGFQMLGGSWRFFQVSGRLDELELWLDRFFAAEPSPDPTNARSQALMARGALHYWRSQWLEANDDYQAALAIAESSDDHDLLRDALLGALTSMSNAVGLGIDVGDPAPLLARVRRMATEADDPIGLAFAEFHEIVTTHGQATGSGPPVAGALDNGVRLMKEAGRNTNVAHLRAAQAELLIAEGNLEQARQYALEALDAAETAGDVFAMSWALNRLAIIIYESGDHDLGLHLAGAADEATKRSGGAIPPPFVPITDTLERARATMGGAAEAPYEDGKEIGLIPAAAMAREAEGS
jgi:tetratricopeptide (TPR) repeat protein